MTIFKKDFEGFPIQRKILQEGTFPRLDPFFQYPRVPIPRDQWHKNSFAIGAGIYDSPHPSSFYNKLYERTIPGVQYFSPEAMIEHPSGYHINDIKRDKKWENFLEEEFLKKEKIKSREIIPSSIDKSKLPRKSLESVSNKVAGKFALLGLAAIGLSEMMFSKDNSQARKEKTKALFLQSSRDLREHQRILYQNAVEGGRRHVGF